LFWILVGDFYILIVLGACHVETPYVTASLCATIFYFAWFLVLVPVAGIIENSLMSASSTKLSFHPATKSKVMR
jgi:ubiquinol-cytochrome c reductase cytochrome b subunit